MSRYLEAPSIINFLSSSPPGQALYSSGMFESALLHFYRATRQVKHSIRFRLLVIDLFTPRLRKSPIFEEWIERCEESIRNFFSSVKFDLTTVSTVLGFVQIFSMKIDKFSRKISPNCCYLQNI